jgi:hypothetical protein
MDYAVIMSALVMLKKEVDRGGGTWTDSTCLDLFMRTPAI